MNGCFGDVGFGLRKSHVNIYGCLRGEKTPIAGGAGVEGGDQWVGGGGLRYGVWERKVKAFDMLLKASSNLETVYECLISWHMKTS